jgi:regulator of RNase E activity RraB
MPPLKSTTKCQAVEQELDEQLYSADIVASLSAEIALGKNQVEQALSLAEQAAATAHKMGGIYYEKAADKGLDYGSVRRPFHGLGCPSRA